MIGYQLFGGKDYSISLKGVLDKECLCRMCGVIRNLVIRKKIKTPKIECDSFNTIDGHVVFGNRTKELFGQCIQNVEVLSLDDKDQFYLINPKETIEFDLKRRGSEIGAKCSECGVNGYGYGFDPVLLKGNGILDGGAYKTDLYFGDGENRAPLLIVSKGVGLKIIERRFDIVLNPVYRSADTVTTKTGYRFGVTSD